MYCGVLIFNCVSFMIIKFSVLFFYFGIFAVAVVSRRFNFDDRNTIVKIIKMFRYFEVIV